MLTYVFIPETFQVYKDKIDLIWVNFKQIHDEVGPDKVKYPMHDELGFLESNYKLMMSSVFKSS